MRKVVMLFFFLAFSLTCFASASFSSEAEVESALDVGKMDYLILPDSSADVYDVSGRYAEGFVPVPDGVVRFRKFDRTLWLRVSMQHLKNIVDSFAGRDTLLILNNEYIARADWFVPTENGKFSHRYSGADTPMKERSLPSRFPVLPLDNSFWSRSSFDEGEYVYLNVRSRLPISFNVTVRSERAFYTRFVDRLTTDMAFYGFMAALTLMYLLFHLMTGDGLYLLVVLRQFAAFAFLFFFNGYLQYYFNAAPYAVYVLIWYFWGMHCVAGAFFSSRMLQMDTEFYGRWLAYLQTCIGVVMTLSALADYPFMTLSLAFLALAVEVVSFAAVGFFRFRQGHRMILLYLCSRVAFVAGVVFLSLNVFSPWQLEIPEYVAMVCFLLDPVLLAGMLIPATRRRLENYFSLEEKSIRYEKMSQRDGMTGLFNKAYLLSLLADHIRAAKRDGKELAFMMLDIDHFKRFNDTWGHPEGDRMLGFLAKVIRQSLRESDIAARYGGEEFSVILPGGTLPTSILVGERIRKTFEKESATLGEKKTSTVSVGLSFLRPDDTVTTLVQRADDALYRAKANGRNRTEFEVTA